MSAAAGISAAYVVKLFPRKEKLFLAAPQDCFDRIEQALLEVDVVAVAAPDVAMDRMSDA